MKKNVINIFIGAIVLIGGIKLYDSGIVLCKYIGVLFMIYGVLVIVTKFIKIISSSKNKQEQLQVFEKDNNIIIPSFIREILEFQLENNRKIEFEIPHYGTFSILDYNQKGEDLSAPNYIVKEIDEHIKRYLFPAFNYSKIIPFATSGDYMFLFVEEGKNDIILIDLDSMNKRPFVLSNKIDDLLSINKMELRNDIYYCNKIKKIEDIVEKNNYFFDVPDCIVEAKDYFEIYAKSFNLLKSKFVFSFLNILENEENYILNISIEGQSKEVELRKYSDYIDAENFIQSLNEILLLLNYNQKKYYLISHTNCDFGVVLADKKTYKKLSENGCIEVTAENLKLNSEEIHAIQKYSDLITEIDNIEFYLNLTKKHNELKESIVYDFLYETVYEFDNNGIEALKRKLNVTIKKVDSGYLVYFVI